MDHADHIEYARRARATPGEPYFAGGNSKSVKSGEQTEIDIMCKFARKTVLEQSNFQNHATCLLAVLDEAVQERSHS